MLEEHLEYASDLRKLDAYRAAIAAVVKPGDRVLDLGCGSGVLGLLALEQGAGVVYAIDESMMADVARQTFAKAGHGSNAVVIHDNSSHAVLPERVDVVICDNIGYLGIDYFLLDALSDARSRHLKPGGKIIPRRLSVHAALASSKSLHDKACGWSRESIPAGLHWLNEYSINSKMSAQLSPQDLLSPSQMLIEVELGEELEFVTCNLDFECNAVGTVHGIAGWFEAQLADGVFMSNSPLGADRISRPQAFLPVGEPFDVEVGDLVQVSIRIRPSETLIAWKVVFAKSGISCSHSTWNARPVSRETVEHANRDRIPRLTNAGQARRIVSGYCDGVRTAAEIEALVLTEHPGLMPSARELRRFVASVLARDTE
jgi:protein arginine N-methyltransferase 1